MSSRPARRPAAWLWAASLAFFGCDKGDEATPFDREQDSALTDSSTLVQENPSIPVAEEYKSAHRSSELSGRGRDSDVILLTMDTTRPDHLGCYGFTLAETPSLDRIASEGVLFERAMTVTPMTLPSHVSILTGQYPLEHGVRDNGLFRVAAKTVTLAEHLQDAGYQTAGFVSSYVLNSSYGTSQGFSHFDDEMTSEGGRGAEHPRVERSAAETIDAALEWLERSGDSRPIFLWLHFYDPHVPYQPPVMFQRKFANAYDGEIAAMDQQIGRFFDAWSSLRPRPTLTVATADHGDGLGEHGEDTHGLFVYNSTMWVPLLVRHPALGSGKRIPGRVSVIDIVPTILDLVGVALPAGLTGSSLLPGIASGTPWLRPIYLETQNPLYINGIAPLEALCRDRFKYIHAPRPELYDLEADPRETRNLMESLPDEARRLQQEIHGFRSGQSPVHAVRLREMSEEEAEKLAQLGYVQDGPRANAEMDPKDFLRWKKLRDAGYLAMNAGHLAQAKEAFQKVLEKCPDDAETLAWLGQVLVNEGEVEAGIRSMERALELRPNILGTAQNVARLYRRQGQPERALQALELILEHSPRELKFYLSACKVCEKQKDWDRALNYLKRAEASVDLGREQRKTINERRAAIAAAREG